MKTSPLYYVVNSLPITRGLDAITVCEPIPYEDAIAMRDALQSKANPEEAYFEICEA